MKIVNYSFFCLFFTIMHKCTATTDGLIDTLNIFDVGKKVHALFSPNVFEAYSYKLENMADITNNPKFKHDRPTVVYIHGWLEEGEFEESVMAVRSAYRIRNDHNIIIMDWSLYSRWMIPVPYKSSISKLKKICEMMADQLDQIRRRGHASYKNFYLVGHSLGGQCAGLVGRTLKQISGGKFVMPTIYALDPAGPGFEFNKIVGVRGFDSISKSDADYVQIIHTNGGRLGCKKVIGHSDFFVNGGSEQPGCKLDICHHQRSWIYFQESVKQDCVYPARECDSYYDFLNGYCDDKEIKFLGHSSNGTQPMGTYYLRTHPSKFGTSMGMDGLSGTKFTLTNQDGTTETGEIPFSFGLKMANNLNMDKVMNSYNNNV